MNLSVNSIETFATVDGPGVRCAVFLNGCTLRCKFCHNPETWHMLEPNYSVLDLYNKIIKCKNYFGELGGVTFSGGEPLLQSNALVELSKKLKEDNIHIALDTAGIGPYKELLPYIDLIIFDIKDITEDRYRDLTGGNINQSLEFIKYATILNKKFYLRLVVIPGVNDNTQYMDDLIKYINTNFKDTIVEKIEFLPFHQMAKDKYQKLGINYPYNEKEEMNKEKCDELYQYFISHL